jgi:hypothetical protein
MPCALVSPQIHSLGNSILETSIILRREKAAKLIANSCNRSQKLSILTMSEAGLNNKRWSRNRANREEKCAGNPRG